MARLKKLACCVLALTFFGTLAVQTTIAAEPPGPAEKTNDVQKAKDEKKRAARLKLLRQLAEKVEISIDDGGKATPVKLLPEPWHRYSQESRQYPDAVLWGWSNGGRPVAMLTMACFIAPGNRTLEYEFDSLTTKPLICTIDGRERWTPRTPGIEMKPLDDAPKPADDKSARSDQIAKILSRMKAREDWNGTVELPWLPQPVFRYHDADHDVVDGVVCLACVEGNPEVLLVLEAQRHGSAEPKWFYGFNRVGHATMHVKWDDKELWTAPGLGGTSPTDPYCSIGVPM